MVRPAPAPSRTSQSHTGGVAAWLRRGLGTRRTLLFAAAVIAAAAAFAFFVHPDWFGEAQRSPSTPPPLPPGDQPRTLGADQVRNLYRQADELRAQQRWPEAIATLQQAIRIGPYDEEARYVLGGLMEAHSTPEEIVRYYSAEVGTDPKPQTSYYFWAAGLERGGDIPGAIAKLRMALDVDPAHEMSENRWGSLLEKQGNLLEALKHYRLAVEILPEYKEAHENCARVLAAVGRTAESREHLDQARNVKPTSTSAFVSWARYLIRKGRTEAAVAELERALRTNPQDGEAARLLASVRPKR